MSQDPNQKSERTDYPIERGFPIERVNEIAGREGHGGARRYYRPIYAMHKWWARRLGSVFRSICLYSLIDEDADVEVFEPGQNGSLSEYGGGTNDIEELVSNVAMDNPDSLWPLYNKDVRVKNKRVLDPFMGGGTSIVEASRFDANVAGYDLNPVAWFVVKKELDTGNVDPEELEKAYNLLETKISNELQKYYKTPCPSCGEKADVMYYLWVKELDCVSCHETVSLFRDYRIGKGRYGDDGYNVHCPECESIVLSDDWRSDTACSECGHSFVPENGNLERGSQYSCRSCGQKYSATDAVSEQDGYNKRLYAIEYHCPHCESRGKSRGESKGYKEVDQADIDLWEDAVDEWDSNTELHEYVPNDKIRPGWKTASSEFEGSAPGAGDLHPHGITKWTDMFNKRQLLTLSKLLKSIDELDEEGVDKNAQELALLVFSDILRTNTMMTGYTPVNNTINQIFKTNSFDPPHQPAEGNPWGAKYGYATFQASWKTMKSGVEWGKSPTERYVKDGETEESPPFNYPVGENTQVQCRDMNEIDEENVVDAVITDPPYYDNVIYSELSEYFYVWQRIILADEYECFEPLQTPRSESVVANPAEGKDVDDFEEELKNSFGKIRDVIKEDGILAFTYHHSDSESWGELLEALCDVGFEVTAAYPITADINKFSEGEMVSFDIVVVGRPASDRRSTSWNSLRRDIYRTARRTRKQLEENRDLSRGDIGVMEMGACFREYSKHHGKVQRDGEIMSAKEVVQEIYGIIQEASDIGVEDVFIDLLDSNNPSFDDVNKLCRGTNATPEELKEMRLYNQDDGFELGTWDKEKRQAYIQERTNGDGDDHLSNLDKLQFLRYRYEKGQAVQNYVDKWGVDDDLRELAGRLADVTGDDTYTRVLGDRDITSY